MAKIDETIGRTALDGLLNRPEEPEITDAPRRYDARGYAYDRPSLGYGNGIARGSPAGPLAFEVRNGEAVVPPGELRRLRVEMCDIIIRQLQRRGLNPGFGADSAIMDFVLALAFDECRMDDGSGRSYPLSEE